MGFLYRIPKLIQFQSLLNGSRIIEILSYDMLAYYNHDLHKKHILGMISSSQKHEFHHCQSSRDVYLMQIYCGGLMMSWKLLHTLFLSVVIWASLSFVYSLHWMSAHVTFLGWTTSISEHLHQLLSEMLAHLRDSKLEWRLERRVFSTS